MKRREMRIAGAFLALAVGAAGCGLGKDEDGPLPEPPTTAAAATRANLDLLLREHVYLLGLATENAVTSQTAAFEAAIEAVEENALSLADQFEKSYGARGEKAFLAAWRPYTDLVAVYAHRKARKLKLGDVDRLFGQAALRFATFAAGLTPLMSLRVIGARMRDVVGSMRAVADAQVAGDYKKADATLRTASDRAADMASALARAIADDLPAIFPGDPSSAAAGLRTSFSALLVERVYLAGFTSENILTNQPKPRDGAKSAVDASSAALAKLIGASYGADAEKTFLPLWKRGLDLLLSYAGSVKDKAKREKVRQDLKQYATDAAGFLFGLNKELDASSVERILGQHVAAMTQVIDAQAAGDLKRADLLLRAAARQIEALGLALATATVRRFPVRFLPTPAGLPT